MPILTLPPLQYKTFKHELGLDCANHSDLTSLLLSLTFNYKKTSKMTTIDLLQCGADLYKRKYKRYYIENNHFPKLRTVQVAQNSFTQINLEGIEYAVRVNRFKGHITATV